MTPQRPAAPWSLPAELAELEFLEGQLAQYDHARFGVVKDPRARTFTAALRVQGRAFALLGPAEREQRLAEYGAVLAALARDDSAVRRIAWIERTLPGDADELGDYLLQAKRLDARLEEPPEELVSYLKLIGRAGDVAEEHELTFALQIDAQRPAARRAIARLGGGDLGALAVLAGEVGRSSSCSTEPGSPSPACSRVGVWPPRSATRMTRGAGAVASASSTAASWARGASRHTPRARSRATEQLVASGGRRRASLHAVGGGVAADRRPRAVPSAAVDGFADRRGRSRCAWSSSARQGRSARPSAR